mmetsp:Transcript_13009/g.20177  ORF Transcript_13009/g.20177 Transcript_13009/m.20177 type:complete len:113 (-) Transcript_13009:437-775(-)
MIKQSPSSHDLDVSDEEASEDDEPDEVFKLKQLGVLVEDSQKGGYWFSEDQDLNEEANRALLNLGKCLAMAAKGEKRISCLSISHLIFARLCTPSLEDNASLQLVKEEFIAE